MQARLRGVSTMTQLCRRFGISRVCGYKWWGRFLAGGRRGLTERSRRGRAQVRPRQRWWGRVQQARHQERDWGAPKLCWLLHKNYRRGPWLSEQTVGRWLATAGLIRVRRQRARPDPRLRPAPPVSAQAANDVWTIDFKGWFYTAGRKRVCALTVRDQAIRDVLAVRQVRPREAEVAAVLQALFRRHGLPRALNSDNGPPFGSKGPRGWSPLSVRWLKLGLAIEFGRPGCPQDNAAHEQMHRVLKAATARPPAPTLTAQQRRFTAWRRHYNLARPHAALGQRPPAQLYRRSPRVLPVRSSRWRILPHGGAFRLDHRSRLFWHGRQRAVGRAFAHERIGLQSLSRTSDAIYLWSHLPGNLHAGDQTGNRAVVWRNAIGGKREALRPSLRPPRLKD